MSEVIPTDPVDTHDAAGMAQWLRERRDAALEFYKLDSEAQQRHFLQRWQQHVLPHLAFRFGQAATMIELLEREKDGLAAVAATRNVNIVTIAEERDRAMDALRLARDTQGGRFGHDWPYIELKINEALGFRVGALDVTGDGKRKIGDACPACSARLGESQRQVRCANCGWLGTYTPQGG